MAATPYVSRVNQIDASQLDDEIYNVLKNQSNEISKFLPPGTIGKWQPEINALLMLAVWNYSLRTGNSTFGQQLLNLNYANYDRRKAVLYVVLTIVPKYLQERLTDTPLTNDNDTNGKIKFFMDWVATVVHLMAFVNLLTFLHRGNQPHVIERFLGISNQSVISHKPRNIGYSYMTRELLWHGLIELFTVGLPMVNFQYIKQRLVRLWFGNKKSTRRIARPQMDSATKCPDCEHSPNLPRHAGCEHVFCYYCLKARFMADEVFQCPVCGKELHANRMRTL